MILRPYQEEAINATEKALHHHGNTLVIAPTGSGKTIMMASTIDRLKRSRSGKTVVIQHRLKLVEQNARKFMQMNGDFYSVGVLTGTTRETDAEVIFATVQTLEKNLELVGEVSHFIIDEAHHAAANSYFKCIKHLKELNGNMVVLGYTATAERSDGKGIGDVFDNVAYRVEIDLLIELGYLVPPDSFIIDIGVDKEIAEVTAQINTLSDADRDERLTEIYKPHLGRIVKEWENKARERHTVVFCTTIEQAESLVCEFKLKDHDARVIHSHMKQIEVQETMKAFDAGEFHVLVNVAILTEGYDCPPVDCIMLVRGCSSQSTMTQMLGRGLRIIEPDQYEWSKKTDCMILDFGDSIRVHGTLRCDVNLKEIRKKRHSDNPFSIICPHCKKLIIVEIETTDCLECGGTVIQAIEDELLKEVVGKEERGPRHDKIVLTDWKMTAAKLTGYSPFAWVDLTESDLHGLNHQVFVASGFNAYVAIIKNEDQCVAVGRCEGGRHKVVGSGREKVVFAQANNFMSNNETSSSSKKSSGWMRKPISARQLNALKKVGWRYVPDSGMNRYKASCLMSYLFNNNKIYSVLGL
jgi:DNA repair protein RadD